MPSGPSRAVEALQITMGSDGDGLDTAGDGLAELIRHYAHAVAVAPSLTVYGELASARSFAGTLLERGRRAQRPDLAVTAGWLSSLLAIAATDLGDHGAAVVWCTDTERRGRDAGHPELLAWAALTRSQIAWYQGDPMGSAAAARQGQTEAPAGTVVRAKLAAQEMRCLAMTGDTTGMSAAHHRAAAAMGQLTQSAPLSGIYSAGTPMSDSELTGPQITALTASVDIDAPPPDTTPAALVLFGTNQAAPVRIAADRYHRGLAPMIIATGGINRHNGIVEGREFARQLTEAGVPAHAIRVEDQSKDTWQNIELSLPHLREALAMGLPLAAVSKWYHLRAVYCLHTQLPEAAPLYAIGWDPIYAGMPVTRDSWPSSPDGRRRVIRESQEVPRRVAEGSYRPAAKKNGAWS